MCGTVDRMKRILTPKGEPSNRINDAAQEGGAHIQVQDEVIQHKKADDEERKKDSDAIRHRSLAEMAFR